MNKTHYEPPATIGYDCPRWFAWTVIIAYIVLLIGLAMYGILEQNTITQ